MKPRWFFYHRQAWITDMLRVYGFVNIHHVSTMFGISPRLAMNDMRAYCTKHPHVHYDASRKAYVRR